MALACPGFDGDDRTAALARGVVVEDDEDERVLGVADVAFPGEDARRREVAGVDGEVRRDGLTALAGVAGRREETAAEDVLV